MAWHIGAQVIHGEIDNRVRGRVTGRIWMVGHDVPVELDLAGNALRDLAGRRFEFSNPKPEPSSFVHMFSRQQVGVLGDCTASRRMRAPPLHEEPLASLTSRKAPSPYPWANCLSLEWFSATECVVVILEGIHYRVTLEPDYMWEMTTAEEAQQRRANSKAKEIFLIHGFHALARELGLHALLKRIPDEAELQTEEEAQRMLEDGERISQRTTERLLREGCFGADEGKIRREEEERDRRERGPVPPAETEKRGKWRKEMVRMTFGYMDIDDPNVRDGIREKANRRHPLVTQTFALTDEVTDDAGERGWLPDADIDKEETSTRITVNTPSSRCVMRSAMPGAASARRCSTTSGRQPCNAAPARSYGYDAPVSISIVRCDWRIPVRSKISRRTGSSMCESRCVPSIANATVSSSSCGLVLPTRTVAPRHLLRHSRRGHHDLDGEASPRAIPITRMSGPDDRRHSRHARPLPDA